MHIWLKALHRHVCIILTLHVAFVLGIAHQTEKFPISFILELLNKPTRVVLTGFLVGGLLACSVATQIWKCGLFSNQELQERLSCITFSQPHINVPELSEVAKSHPEIISTLYAIYREDDAYPTLLMYLNLPLHYLLTKFDRSFHKLPPVSIHAHLFFM